MFIRNGVQFNIDQAFVHNGIQYLSGWARSTTPEQRTAVGITEVAQDPKPDERLNWVTANVDGTWSSTPKDPAVVREILSAYASNKRWQVETGGCTWNDLPVATDRDSQTKLIAEFVAMGAALRTDPSPWKFADGTFANLSNADMGAVIMAARAHIAEAFAVEASVLADIASDDITTFAEIDAADWPGA